MELDIYQVDAFTSEPFKGNPAGVCITDSPLSEDVMRAIAKEMALSETAFLCRSDMNLRWFTPDVEVKLCGHGTLSVVHILLERKEVKLGQSICFNTLSGRLEAKVIGEDIELVFPNPELITQQDVDQHLLCGLGLTREQICYAAQFDEKILLEVATEKEVLELEPNFDSLAAKPGRGVVVTAQSNQLNVDMVSRYFAPWVGVNEDPVTGSAHCALAVHWSKRLDKTSLKAYQASQRGGYLTIDLIPGNQSKLKGQAVTVLKGRFII